MSPCSGCSRLERELKHTAAELSAVRSAERDAVAEAERQVRSELEEEHRRALQRAAELQLPQQAGEEATGDVETEQLPSKDFAERISNDRQTIEELELALENHRDMMLEMQLEVEEAQSIAEAAKRESADQEQLHAAALRRAEEEVKHYRMACEQESAAAQRAVQEGSRAEHQSAAALHRSLVAMNRALHTVHSQGKADLAACESAQAERDELVAHNAELQARSTADRQHLLQQMQKLVNEHEAKVLEFDRKLADCQSAAEENRQEAERLQSSLDAETARRQAISEDLVEARRQIETQRVFRQEAEKLQSSLDAETARRQAISEDLVEARRQIETQRVFRQEAEKLQSSLDAETARRQAISEDLVEARREIETERVFRQEAEKLQSSLDAETARRQAISEDLVEARREIETERVFRQEAEKLQSSLDAETARRQAISEEQAHLREELSLAEQGFADYKVLIEHLLRDLSSTQQELRHNVQCLRQAEVSILELQDNANAVEVEAAGAAICTGAAQLALEQAEQLELCKLLEAALQSALGSADATHRLVEARTAELSQCKATCEQQHNEITTLKHRVQQHEEALLHERAERTNQETALKSEHEAYVTELRNELERDKEKECARLREWKVRSCTQLAEQIVALQDEHKTKVRAMELAQEEEAQKAADATHRLVEARTAELSQCKATCEQQHNEITTLKHRVQQHEEALLHERAERTNQETALKSEHEAYVTELRNELERDKEKECARLREWKVRSCTQLAKQIVALQDEHKTKVRAMELAQEEEAQKAADVLSKTSTFVESCKAQQDEITRIFKLQSVELSTAQGKLEAERTTRLQEHTRAKAEAAQVAEELASMKARCEQQEAAYQTLRTQYERMERLRMEEKFHQFTEATRMTAHTLKQLGV